MARYETFVVRVDDRERLRFEADLSRADLPLWWIDNGESIGAPMQTADVMHDAVEAASALNDWLRSEGGEAWGEDEAITVEEVRS